MSGGEGPWAPGIAAVQPGVLIAGTNPVATDAVGLAVMGFDPMADRGTYPFMTSDNMLRLAEDAGLGTRDLKRIEVVGTAIKDVMFEYATPEKRNAKISRNLRRANSGYGGSVA